MGIIDESQLDQGAAPSGGHVIDESQLDQGAAAVRPGDVEARRRQVQARAAAEPANVARERQTFMGEVTGGLKQTLDDVLTMFNPEEKDMGMVERLLHGARAPLGLVRAATPIATLGTSPVISNIATMAGEKVSEGLQKAGFTNVADVAGGLTQMAGDITGGMGTARLAGKLKAPLARALPTRAEKLAVVNKEQGAAEATINAEAEAARRTAEATKANIQSNTESAIASEQSLGQAAKDFARKQADEARAAVSTPAKAEALVTTKNTSEDLGRRVQERIYAPKRQASTDRFNKEYGEIEAAGSKVKVDAEEYKAAADKIYGKPEAGVSRPLQSKAETAAGGAKRALEIEDEHYQDLVARAENAKQQGLGNADILAEEVKRRRAEFEGKMPTVTELIHERQRLRAAERAAYDIGNDKLGHQFKELQEAIGRDIRKVDEGISGRLSAADTAYASEHIPFFGPRSEIRKAMESGPEAVIDKLVPKATDVDRVAKVERLQQFIGDPASQKQVGDGFIRNMIGDATKMGEEKFGARIQSVWARYSDSRTGDKVLKTVLGDRYQPMKDIVEAARKAKPKTINQSLEKAVKEIEANTSARASVFDQRRMSEMKTLEGVLGEGERMIGDVKIAAKAGSIEKARLAKLELMKKEFQKKAEKIGLKKIPDHGGQLVGTAMILHGGVGAIMGGAAALGQILSGGIVLLAAPGVMKLTNTVRGAEMLKKLMRSVPGTAQAAAQARIVQQYLQEPDED